MSKKTNFFWASYADLMTSLFFIMLVLFVLVIAMMKRQQAATEQQLRKIIEIQSAVKELPAEYFIYEKDFKRFALKKNVEFVINTDILKKQSDEKYLINVGQSVKKLIDTLKVKYKNQDIKYLILIEGMSSSDNYKNNYLLSYARAWAVKKLWDTNNIDLDPSICEIQISGSGPGGIGRYRKNEDKKNQRILIQIIPKIGNID